MTNTEDEAERRAALADRKQTLRDLAEAGEDSATAIAAAFDTAGGEIERALSRAARTGELSFRDMAEDVARSLAALAVDRLVSGSLDGVGERLGRLTASIGDAIGQRAEGGPVQAGDRYLVGERGPELFTPGIAGAVTPLAPAAPVNVTIYAGGETAEAVRRSERQIAAALARAMLAGRRSL